MEKDLHSFSDSYLKNRPEVREARVPVEGTLELTRLCSLKCRHCYIGDARWIPDPGELPGERVLELLDEFTRNGTLWLTLTGGEPLMRRDFPLIWKAAHEKGFLLILFTNATLISPVHLSLWKEYPPMRVEVSLYGPDRETYENFTMIPGSYSRFLRGLGILRDSGIPWLLKATLTKELLPFKDELIHFAREWNVPFHWDSVVTPSIGAGISGGNAPCSSRVSPEEAVKTETRDETGVKDLLSRRMEKGESETALFECGAARNSFYLTARGDLQGCHLTGHRAESLGSESFTDAWDKLGQISREKRRPESPCMDCDLRSICRNCPGLARLETGDEQMVSYWACRQTHLKARYLGISHQCSIRHPVYRRKTQV